MMTTTDEWVSNYRDLMPEPDDLDGLIPFAGIRIMLGITNEGRDSFTFEVDSDGGKVDVAKTLHMLHMVQRILEDREMINFGISVSQPPGSSDE